MGIMQRRFVETTYWQFIVPAEDSYSAEKPIKGLMQTMLYYGSLWLKRINAWKHMIKASYTGFHRNMWNSSHMTQKSIIICTKTRIAHLVEVSQHNST
jgi:hypothetical protein